MKICERPEFKSKKPPLTFFENDKVLNAVKAMSKDNFGSVIIVDKQKMVLGIVTERDLMRKLLYKSMNPKTTKLKDLVSASFSGLFLGNLALSYWAPETGQNQSVEESRSSLFFAMFRAY